MVFCEAPVDFAYGGAPAGAGTVVAKLAADACAGGDVSKKAAAEEAKAEAESSEKGPQAEAECALAFDGLNCFETVVRQPSH